MKTLFTIDFWSYAGERAIKTIAQAAVAVLGSGVAGILEVDWTNIVSISLLAGLVSILTSLANFDGDSLSD